MSRDANSNIIDNMTARIEAKNRSLMNNAINSQADLPDRTSDVFRDGLWRQGAFQMFVPKNHNFATFGFSSNRTVGK